MTAINSTELKHPLSAFQWQAIATFTLAFWLGSSLLLDLIIMPELYAAGMMTQADFGPAGYAIFWVFNRIELLCAALVMTSVAVLHALGEVKLGQRAIALAAVLMAIALTYTYALSPEMSSLGMQLNLFATSPEVPASMTLMHGSYWVLETTKLAIGAILAATCYRLGHR